VQLFFLAPEREYIVIIIIIIVIPSSLRTVSWL
jgi:hypothetical protein